MYLRGWFISEGRGRPGGGVKSLQMKNATEPNMESLSERTQRMDNRGQTYLQWIITVGDRASRFPNLR
jgi:hypothetical protein